MTSWFSKLNPTPSFPPYTGPYKVGSTHVEIPVAELESPATSPAPKPDLSTVAFRVFYPCQQDSQQRGVRWIPSPQREYVGAYARFLGANNAFAHIFSVVPQLLYYISIPVHHNAEILEPTTNSKRWPVMFFSHGLGGSRNAYSHICGSLASHGIVVVAPDHRDGSAPISFVRTPGAPQKLKKVDYLRVPHQASTEVYEARDEQLRIRLWELGLIHDALLKIDTRVALSNIAEDQAHHNMLVQFSNKLDIHTPGSIAWTGHSFGAATMIQFTKSIFYRQDSTTPSTYRPLYVPSPNTPLTQQITSTSPLTLLDLWALPLQSPSTTWLKSQPMPCYTPGGPGGSTLLSILSEAFYKWSTNLQQTLSILSAPQKSDSSVLGAHIFYPTSSAHLSQSDFGTLFPWVTTKVFGVKEPQRVMKLNVRAILQLLRDAGVEVADTSAADMEVDGLGGEKTGVDKILLTTEGHAIRDWISLRSDDLKDVANGGKVEGGPLEAAVETEVLGEVARDKGSL
ncbi:hypothetical protein BU24DRAFT_420962 [Aaosphaeria arxii CBS 175.79]|uniref:Putative phospholipase n=1 Tax=Aaosphaeria arxii CBS 175.79 TaxID=1450172 RepID=A0A6A5XYB4_9PLEO|nr:uncharacterized protein BU24DRAFT_420962 [Aaosphaeria arxii CBS 175.79]KAF2017913.1 hypothetical protein BU24DRAFT_420962 [Aaosphaeria arxii CBS 175.79]